MFNARTLPLWFFHPATFCCKAGVEKKLRYQKDVGMAEDMWFMFDLLMHDYKMLIIPEYIFNWRKIQAASSTLQINQSLELLANFKARYLMYKKLYSLSNTLPSSIKNYLLTDEYRQVFVYNSLLVERRFGANRYNELEIDSEYLDEINDYARRHRTAYRRLNIRIDSLIAFLKVAGYLNGSLSIIRMAVQKFLYKFR